jgi:hypothetical protein
LASKTPLSPFENFSESEKSAVGLQVNTLITVSPLDFVKWLETLRSVPVVEQVRLMGNAPFLHDAGYFTWQLALKHLARLHGHQRFKTLVFSVNVGWRMIVVPHADDDAEEAGDGWYEKFYALLSQSPRLSASARIAVCKGMAWVS